MIGSFSLQERQRKVLFTLLAAICLLPGVTSPLALILGFILANLGWLPNDWEIGKLTKKLLAVSIVGLGFGIPLQQAIDISTHNLPLILGSIIMTLLIGTLLTKLLRLEQRTGHLIACGTAICGGSAIAAVAPAINAKSEQTAIALACVFILNSIALFIFPVIGHLLAMSQHDFGVWSAIAIHDTSSVVGAASAYGEEALKTATTIKLARALWIIPVAALSAVVFGGKGRMVIPAFILYYCLAIAITSLLPQGHALYQLLFVAGKHTLVVCLFLIGCGITVKKLRTHGRLPLLMASLLWLAIGSGSLLCVLWLS
ncbi:YeiH family protein [Shewanella dokdonensis]|uniref:Sulfate exporter family transporter n=1 Tax=Shewanella dokdonensis TaxID=712036 RepID=A0ABX8DI80_9GAMM|nr:putative sulfate exporter family transporter [Shewanella dokdonensis]MCL1076169.1 putative sulfate exporter family transporter [Shewanella dokdonensis]QVK24446.1 putative sulfate exporter family transporter [Shewanella dokdonensis]